ncbi:MAG: hypothetical protein B7733_16520 [Myxococcales bacterium FL481]|nr:MAG: hypothetical protein B7733_16520 [Myxococcales bacterium FL481]
MNRLRAVNRAVLCGLWVALAGACREPADGHPSQAHNPTGEAVASRDGAPPSGSAAPQPGREPAFAMGLRVHPGVSGSDSPFRVPAKVPVSWSLSVPLATEGRGATVSWSDVEVSRFIARVPGGLQRSLVEPGTRAAGPVKTEFSRRGPALVSGCVETKPAGPRRADVSTTYCAKTLLSVDGGETGFAPVDLTGKIGSAAELRPLISPLTAKRGADMPTFCYIGHEKHPDTEVVVHRPDGSTQTLRTNANRVVNIRLDQVGPWRVSCERRVDGRRYVADLFFELPDNGVL